MLNNWFIIYLNINLAGSAGSSHYIQHYCKQFNTIL